MNVVVEKPLENVENPDEAAKLIRKMDKMIKISKKHFDNSLQAR